MIVTFDFDGTLRSYDGEDLLHNHRKLKDHLMKGHRVNVVTKRHPDIIHAGIDGIGVHKYIDNNFGHLPLHFTYGDYKYAYLSRLGSELHYDDEPEEIKLIKENTYIRTILV